MQQSRAKQWIVSKEDETEMQDLGMIQGTKRNKRMPLIG